MNSKRAREDLSSVSDTIDNDPDYSIESKRTKKTYINFDCVILPFLIKIKWSIRSKRKHISQSNVVTTSKETQSDCYSSSDGDQDYAIEAKRYKNDSKM